MGAVVDLAESEGIRRAFGLSADKVCVSATKSVLGHMINGAGAVELAVTALTLRDGFAPPTLNLEDPDPAIYDRFLDTDESEPKDHDQA